MKEFIKFMITFIISVIIFVATVLTLQFSTSIILKGVMLIILFMTSFYTMKKNLKGEI